jgi:TonB family protein
MRLSIFFNLILTLTSPVSWQQPAETWPPPGVHESREAGVTPPRLLKEVKPQYTPAAYQAGIAGVVMVDCVVEADGSVGAARVTRSVDAGLDQEALKAVKRWRFAPATKDTMAIAVAVRVPLDFVLREANPGPLQLPKAFGVTANQIADGAPAWERKMVAEAAMVTSPLPVRFYESIRYPSENAGRYVGMICDSTMLECPTTGPRWMLS